MKLNKLIKAIPFISTAILIVFLIISNQKVNTKLRILIWNTPSLSLGTYLAISTGTGFILSYIFISNIARISREKSNKSISYKYEKIKEDTNENSHFNFRDSINKTLIERDVNDPSPTINAKFRVIGKTERYNTNYINNNPYDKSIEFENQYNEGYDQGQSFNTEVDNSNDWNDDSFTSW